MVVGWVVMVVVQRCPHWQGEGPPLSWCSWGRGAAGPGATLGQGLGWLGGTCHSSRIQIANGLGLRSNSPVKINFDY